MTIKAIETKYNGYRFRSRLEARWAVFFDALGIQYEYEPEGFDLDGVWYLPDFWLPELGYWLEIKPSNNSITKEDTEKACRFTYFIHPLHMVIGYPKLPKITIKKDEHQIKRGCYHVRSFGKIKKGESFVQTAMSQNEKFPWHTFEFFVLGGEKKYVLCDTRTWIWQERNDNSFLIWPVPSFEVVEQNKGDIPVFMPASPGEDDIKHMFDYVLPFTIKKHNTPALISAYDAARSARFEHGESGATL